MVTTRRQSKDFEPVELPRAIRQKRKLRNDATPATSAAQPPYQPSSKRRKKVKSTAKIDTPPVTSGAKPAVPPEASSSRKAQHPEPFKATMGKTHKQRPQQKDPVQHKASVASLNRMREPPLADLTRGSDTSDDEAARRPRPIVSRDADDEDADSRYALGSKQKDKTKKPAARAAWRTAELEFEEDNLGEVDKAKAAVADASNRAYKQKDSLTHLPSKSANGSIVNRIASGLTGQVNGRGRNGPNQEKVVHPPGIRSRVVMFTIVDAIAVLSLYKDGTMSVPAEVDPQSRQPYEPLQTGEFLTYPVKGSYHLGALGRYGLNAALSVPFSLTVPLSEFSIIQHTRDTSVAEPSRQGLGFASALSNRPQAPTVRRPNNYCFTFGKFRGRRMDTVPITYLRAIFNSDEYHANTKLQQAFADLYPKGLNESEAESFTFEKGGFKGKRLDEVPPTYLWGLIRKMEKGELLSGKKEMGRLERALEVWEKGQLDLTQD
ncbi:hypothetical protein SVAN01_03682 [Stagonosporopsis vannaccii]|nr:hypothetical protein SVAN01_03682 [Stagonosporopsis vannaccii]